MTSPDGAGVHSVLLRRRDGSLLLLLWCDSGPLPAGVTIDAGRPIIVEPYESAPDRIALGLSFWDGAP